MRSVKLLVTALCLIIPTAGGPITAQTRRAWEFDEFSGFTCEDLKARLDNLAVAAPQERDAQGFVIVYGGSRGLRNEAQAWIERAGDYLFRDRGLDAGRVALLTGGYRETRSVELWLVPKGADPPSATSTVRPEDVRLKKGSARKFVARLCAE